MVSISHIPGILSNECLHYYYFFLSARGYLRSKHFYIFVGSLTAVSFTTSILHI